MIRLAKSVTVVLDANGQGIIYFAPERYGDTWEVERISTVGDSDAQPQLRIYRGAISPNHMLDSTRSGNTAISETDIVVSSGETLIGLYSYGTPGKTMTLSIEGRIKTWRSLTPQARQ